MHSHKVNEILMDLGIIRHLRVKCQPDLILILGCYDVSVYFGQNNRIMSLIFIFLICYRGRDRFAVVNRVCGVCHIRNIRCPDKNHRIVSDTFDISRGHKTGKLSAVGIPSDLDRHRSKMRRFFFTDILRQQDQTTAGTQYPKTAFDHVS